MLPFLMAGSAFAVDPPPPAQSSESYFMAQRLHLLNGKDGASSKNDFDSNSGKASGASEGAK